MIDPFRLAIAILPLAAYLLVIGLVNLRARPLVTSGSSDLAALGLAISGLIVVGPMELFMPEAAALRFGPRVWVFLLVFYWLCLSLLVLLSRPRIVIYNLALEELRPLLFEAARQLDPGARWAGDSLCLPAAGVQLHVDYWSWMRHISLVASGSRQRLDGWRLLESALRTAATERRVAVNSRGLVILALAALLAGGAMSRLLADPAAVAQGMQQMLRR